jgi:hypothetical protein
VTLYPLQRSFAILLKWATIQKVTGSIPDEIIGFFSLPILTSCTIALGVTQPLTEISIRNLPGGKGLLACKAILLWGKKPPLPIVGGWAPEPVWITWRIENS